MEILWLIYKQHVAQQLLLSTAVCLCCSVYRMFCLKALNVVDRQLSRGPAAYVGHMTSIVSQDRVWLYAITCMLSMHPRSRNNPSTLVHARLNDPDGDCCLSRAGLHQPLYGARGQHACQCLTLYVTLWLYELTGSFSLPWKAARFFLTRYLGMGNREGLFSVRFWSLRGQKKERVTNL